MNDGSAILERLQTMCRDIDSKCPVVDTFCCDVTTEDWVRVMKHVFKDYPL